MAEIVYGDRVKEITLTTGTGNYTLTGPLAGFQGLSDGIGESNTTHYCCTNGVDFETGYGTIQAGGTSINRGAIISSTNGGAAVDWPAGPKTIFITIPYKFFELFSGPLVPTHAAGRNEVNAPTSAAIGEANRVDGPASLAIGSGALPWLPGQLALSGGMLDAVKGSAQTVICPLSCQTADNTPTYLLPYGISGDYNELTLSNLRDDTAAFYRADVLAVDIATGEIKTWTAEWAESKVGSAAPTLIGTPTVTAKFASAGGATWTLTVESTTQGGRLQVTGENSHDINWHATQIMTHGGY